jgi:hypothetical protein
MNGSVNVPAFSKHASARQVDCLALFAQSNAVIGAAKTVNTLENGGFHRIRAAPPDFADNCEEQAVIIFG